MCRQRVANSIRLQPKPFISTTLDAMSAIQYGVDVNKPWRFPGSYVDYERLPIVEYVSNPSILQHLLAAGANIPERKLVRCISDSICAKLLLNAGFDVSVKDNYGYTVLHDATERDLVSLMEVWLKAGADVNAVSQDGLTPLHLVRSDKSIRLLLQHKASVGRRDKLGRVALHCVLEGEGRKVSVYRPLKAMVELLVEAGSPLHLRDRSGKTPLHYGAREIALLEIMFSRSKSETAVNATDRYRKTALHWAATLSNPRGVDLLIDAGGDPNVADASSKTPLHLVVNAAAAHRLIEAGANVEARDASGKTPLHCVRNRGVATALIDSGADPNALDNFGRTPLFYAKSTAIVCVLLKADCDIDAEDCIGQTAQQSNDDKKVKGLLAKLSA